MVKRANKRQLFYRLESIEGTTEGIQTSTDFLEALNLQSNIDQDEVINEAASGTLSKPKSIPGAQRGDMSFGVYVRDEQSVARHASQPYESWITCLLTAGLKVQSTGVPYLVVGTTTSTTQLRAGEILEGASSGATARVLRKIAPSAALVHIHVYDVKGTFLAGEDIDAQFSPEGGGGPGAPGLFNLDATTPTGAEGLRLAPTSLTAARLNTTGSWSLSPLIGEVIRGQTTGAIGVLIEDNSGGGDPHIVIEPSSAVVPFKATGEDVKGATTGAIIALDNPTLQTQSHTPSMTTQDRIDGILKYFKGMRANAQLNAQVGQPVRWDFAFQGGVFGTDDLPIANDAASPTETIVRFVDGTVDVDGLHFPLSQLTVDLQNSLAYRPDPNAVDGQLSVQITDRDPLFTIDPEQLQTKAYNWYSKWKNATGIVLMMQAGSATGSRFAIAARNLQVVNFADGDRDGFLTAQIQLKARKVDAAGDDELEVFLW